MTELIQTTPLALVAALFGLLIGSFLNVVIHRIPIMMEREWRSECEALLGKENNALAEPFNLMTPRSRCPHCDHQISALENIPVISYLMLGGKCKGCKAPISPRYPCIEIISGVSAFIVVAHFGVNLTALSALFLTWSLIALAAIDIDTQLLPDSITLPMLWIGLMANYFDLFVSLDQAVLGAVFGYLLLWGVFWTFKLATGKDGMGYGDFKLLAAIGAWLGWQALPIVIVLSSVVGACVGIALLTLSNHDRSKPIPFGPYLAAAGWIALLWGDDIARMYLGGSNAL